MKQMARALGGAGLGACAVGLLILSAVLSPRAFAETAPTVQKIQAPASDAEIARLLRFRAEKQHRATGMVVGILRPSGRSIVAFGPTGRKAARAMGGDTIFEIASLSKIFTVLLLADTTVRGEAGLDDPLSAYVPPGVKVPQFEGRAITLTDLATHTSALPLRPNNLHAAPDAPNKYASYTLEALYAGLPDYQLSRVPGSRFGYSNLGVALLGQGLALKLHEPFPDLLRRRITGPLGLTDTRFGDDPAAVGRRALGHDVNLRPVGPTDFGALNPAGGLRSTADDILRFLDLFVNGTGPGDLPQAARLMLTVDRPGEDKITRMALGWRRTVAHGETYYWSNGSGDGSRTFMGFNQARHVAVVALADAASSDGLDDIARHILDPQQAPDLTILPIRHAITLRAAAQDRLLGVYQSAPDDRIEITRGLTGLIVTTGPGQLVIYPQSSTRFFARLGSDVLFDFLGAAPAPATALILHQDGKSYVYKRVP